MHSIQDRLKNEARARNRPFAELLELYAVERFLHRLGRSAERKRFVLKGALLLRHWLGSNSRPTRDIDLLGPTETDAESLRETLLDLLALEVEEDGIVFRSETIVLAPIRVESPVIGLRARFDGELGRARLRYQVDVGFGDAVFPATEDVVAGGLLGMPMASVRAYTPYTSIAEKLEAMVVLGESNSRIKDYYDIALLARTLPFDGATLGESIRRTFARRATPIPNGVPEGLGDTFAGAPLNVSRWKGFLDKNRLLESERPNFEEIVGEIRTFAVPVLAAAHEAQSLDRHWVAGGPWR